MWEIVQLDVFFFGTWNAVEAAKIAKCCEWRLHEIVVCNTTDELDLAFQSVIEVPFDTDECPGQPFDFHLVESVAVDRPYGGSAA